MDARTASLFDDIRAAILKNPARPRVLFTLLAIVQRIERLPDPAAHPGDEEEKMGKFREIRDELRRRIEQWFSGIHI